MMDRPNEDCGPLESMTVLGVPISIIDPVLAAATVVKWVTEDRPNFVCVRATHGVMCAHDDPAMMQIHRQAGMVTPDGMPLVWIAHLRGLSRMKRVAGTDLVDAVCHATRDGRIGHFFYGGKDGIARRLVKVLKGRYSGLRVCGTYCPPFRKLTADEDRRVVDLITRSGAKIVWVGISTPKQEYWMADHVGRIPGATLLGVGAAFDFISGAISRAPLWMQRSGLEWLHRLLSEPRRLWHRYLVVGSRFAALALWEVAGDLVRRPRKART